MQKRALPKATEGSDFVGEPSGDRTRDPLIKSNLPGTSTEVHDNLNLEDL
jgi:hypothetical protein